MKKITSLVLIILLAGCTDEDAQRKAQIASQAASEAKASLAQLEWIVSAQKSALSLFSNYTNNRLSNLEARVYNGKSANISATEKGYALTTNEYGSFPVSVAEATPYLDGHKLMLSIGNPLAVSILNGKVVIRYNRKEPDAPDVDKLKDDGEKMKAWQKYSSDYDAWKANTKTVESNIQKPIDGSSWNAFEAILSPSKPEELGYISVELKITGISLLTKKGS